jgi:hypothetical protein
VKDERRGDRGSISIYTYPAAVTSLSSATIFGFPGCFASTLGIFLRIFVFVLAAALSGFVRRSSWAVLLLGLLTLLLDLA